MSPMLRSGGRLDTTSCQHRFGSAAQHSIRCAADGQVYVTDGGLVTMPITELASETAHSHVIVPRRHPWRWVAAAVVFLLGAFAVYSTAHNPRFQWAAVRQYFFSTSVLEGLWRTVYLTVIIMAVGAVLGTVLAVMQQSGNPVLTAAVRVYVWVFRSIPPLVQLLLWFNLAALYPVISIGVPFGPQFWSGSANTFISPLAAAILGLGLLEGAYMAEIIRAGIESVDHGQREAAHSLGFTPGRTMRRVVLPQALRVIVPPTGNETITILKATSLVSVISMADLLYSVQLISSRTFQVMPMLIIASIWYLIVTSVLTVGQQFLERRLGRTSRRKTGQAGSLRVANRRLTALRRQASTATIRPDGTA